MNRALHTISGILIGLVSANSYGQIAKTQVVQVSATANNNGSITLKWPNENYTGNYVIHHRDFIHANNSWKGPDATLAGNITSWTDTLSKGSSREYRVTKVKSGTTEALGYIYVGNQFKSNPTQGGIVIIVDSSYIKALKTEIATLGDDLLGDGWFPSYVVVGRNEKVDAVKTKLEAHIKRLPTSPKALYILGHVPVPTQATFQAMETGPRQMVTWRA
jgi:hypothetical protein